MTPEFPPSPRAEKEARLTAYLLGELPAHEAAAVRLAMDEDVQLAELCERLKPVIKLVRESTTNPAQPATAPSAPLKLSDERRQKLLAQFKTIAPREFVRPPPRKPSLLVPLAAAVVISLLLAALLLPSLSKAKFKARNTLGKSSEESVGRRYDFRERKLALIAPTPAPGSAPAPGTATIVLPSGVEPAEPTQPAANNWSFANGSPNKGSLRGVAQPSVMLKPELEADAITNAGTIAFRDPEWVGTLGPTRVNRTTNHFVGSYAYDASTQLSSGKADGFNLDSIKVPAQSTPTSEGLASTNFLPSPGIASATEQPPQPIALPPTVVSPDIDPATGLPIPKVDTDKAPPLETRIFHVDGEAFRRNLAGVSGDTSANTPNLGGGSGGGGGTVGYGLTTPNVPKIDKEVRQLTELDLKRGKAPPGDDRKSGPVTTDDFQKGSKIQGANQSLLQIEKEQIPIKYANPSNLPTNAAGTFAFDSSEPSSGANKNPSRQPLSLTFTGSDFASGADRLSELHRQASVANVDPNNVLKWNSQVDVLPDGANAVKLIVEDLNKLHIKDEAELAPAEKVPALGDLPTAGRLYRSKSREAQSSDSGGLVLQQQAQKAGVDLANQLTSPAITTKSGRAGLAGYVDSSGDLNPGPGNATVPSFVGSNGSSASPPGMFPGAGVSLGKTNHNRRFYSDLNRNGALDLGVGGGTNSEHEYSLNVVGYVNVTNMTGAIKLVQSEPTILFANGLPQPLKQPAELPAESSVTQKDSKEPVNIMHYNSLILEKKSEQQDRLIQKKETEVAELTKNAKAIDEDAAVKKPTAPAPVPQPEVLTTENAFSTFSLNVSDVSFKLAAASLEKGVLPEPASIRSEEFINAFNYRDPDPVPGAPIGFAWERAHDPFAQNRDLVRFSVKTAAAGREPGRPLNIVLLLDNSGSMERADRVQIIHEALRVLATQLQPQDKLSVVTFARTARLWVDGVAGSEAGNVAEQVGNLTPQGGTNLEEAMRLAYETARRHYLADGGNRVVLLTDGAANLGNVEPTALKAKVEENRKQGIALDCFGIGWEGYNDDLLEILARNGDGRYGFLNTPEEAATDFAGQLAGALRVGASDVKVQVEFNPKRVTAYRQIGYAKHQLTKEQFRDNTVNAAQIGAAESGNALYTIAVNPTGEGPLGTVRVRFRTPGTSDYQEHAWELSYTGDCTSLEQASPAMRLAATASAFSESLATSPFATEVTSDQLLGYLRGVPEIYGVDARPKKLEWMIRQVKSMTGK